MAKKASNKHILVIRLSAMGDVAMTIPHILALRKQHPEVALTVLTKPHFIPIFSGIESISTIAADVKKRHKGISGLWKLYRELKSIGITDIADLHGVLRSRVLSFFALLDRVKTEVIDKGRSEKKALTRPKHKRFVQLKTTIARYQVVFGDLGFPIDVSQENILPPPKLFASATNFFSKRKGCLVGIAPFAAHEGKMYPLELMEEVIEKLLNKEDCQILLFGGGKKETAQLESLASRFQENVQSVAGKITFGEELALISRLHIMVAMDSGNGHLAANYGVPVVTIWGVTHPFAGFAPFNQPKANAILPDLEEYPKIPTSVYGNSYPEGYELAIHSIEPRRIVKRVTEILNSAKESDSIGA